MIRLVAKVPTVVDKAARRLGWDVRPQHALPTDFAPHEARIHERVRPYTMTTPERVQALVDAVDYVTRAEIAGAIVECGVWKGGSMMAVALRLLELGIRDRELWLYDTFAGMTPPTELDTRRDGASAVDLYALKNGKWSDATLDEVRANIAATEYPSERLRYVVGPVEETIEREAPAAIAILRLDTDWYESTRVELERLYPLLAPGGVLILDDYGHWGGARKAVDEYFGDRPVLLSRIDVSARMAVKR
jgi:hypothetical protein